MIDEIILGTDLVVQPVDDDFRAELMRKVRNACRAGFAHDTAEITPDQQQAWWERERRTAVARLYLRDEIAVVGYGLLRRDDQGRYWSSVAVLPQYAGNGYGGAITAHIIRQSPTGTVWAQARKDNPAACALHRAEDWDITGEDARLYHYRTKPDIMTRPQREARAVLA